MSKSTSETDEFYAQIHRRMVESGEWDRCALVSPRPAFKSYYVVPIPEFSVSSRPSSRNMDG